MRTFKPCVILGLALVMAGCAVPSLHPLFTEKELVFDPALVGTWGKEDEEGKWVFTRSGEKRYTVDPQDGEPRKFEGHLVQLGKFRFLDLYPEDMDIKNEIYKIHFIPAHTFWRIWIEDDNLRIALMNEDWLKRKIDAKSVSIAHERMDDLIVLTAPTAKLQELVLKHAEDSEAFPDPEEWQRRK